jgi:hypothetical protein
MSTGIKKTLRRVIDKDKTVVKVETEVESLGSV